MEIDYCGQKSVLTIELFIKMAIAISQQVYCGEWYFTFVLQHYRPI